MPDVIIRGAEIPKSCAVCKIRSYNAYCPLNETIKFMYDPTNRGFDFCTGTHPKCPLEQLSEHGDLVDKDELRKWSYEVKTNRGKYQRVINVVDIPDLPVVIPANKVASD